MFKNIMLYRLQSDWQVTRAQLESALAAAHYAACGPSQDKSVGWIAPRGEDHGALVEVVGGQWLLTLMIEVKSVPGAVVRRKVQEQVEQIEASTGRKPGRKETRDLREEARLALLPLAFSKQSAVSVWIDPAARLVCLDAGSQGKADEVLTCLVKAVAGLALQVVNTQMSPAASMAGWLARKEAPPGFSVDRECELKAADTSGSVVRYTRHPLDTDEVAQHIAMGKQPTRLALTWNDRVSLVLTDALQLKKVVFLEGVLDAAPASPGDREEDTFDTDVAIATGELRKLIPDLLEALGGEA